MLPYIYKINIKLNCKICYALFEAVKILNGELLRLHFKLFSVSAALQVNFNCHTSIMIVPYIPTKKNKLKITYFNRTEWLEITT